MLSSFIIVSSDTAATTTNPSVRFVGTEILFENTTVSVKVCTEADGKILPMLCIEAKRDCSEIDGATVDGVLRATESMLERETKFATLWELSVCPVPSTSCVFHCLRWAMSNKRNLDTFNMRMAIMLPSSSSTFTTILKNVLIAFGPKCSIRTTADLDDAMSFLRVRA